MGVAASLLAACGGDSGGGAEAEPASEVAVQIYADAPGVEQPTLPNEFLSASMTLATESGTRQEDVTLPLESESGADYLQVTVTSGTPVAVSFQVGDGWYGPIRCRLVVDGQTISQQESRGEYAIASCSGVA